MEHLLVFGTVIGCLLLADASSICREVTDIVLLLDSRSKGQTKAQATQDTFKLHQNTASNIVHRLPMSQSNVRVTVAQFNHKRSKVEGISEDSHGDLSTTYKQEKMDVLELINKMVPLSIDKTSNNSGNLLRAFEMISGTVIPKILVNNTKESSPGVKSNRSKVILVTILSGYWSKPEVSKLANVFLRLSKQGVLSYIAAYDMKDHPSDSVLPLLVSKPHFLILPETYQTAAVAGHLAEEFQVCWEDGPCWPNNPCFHGCECVETKLLPSGYECRSSGVFWLTPNCTKPAALLTCHHDRMVLRLPKHYVTETKSSPQDIAVFIGENKWNGSLNDCVAKIVTHAGQDKGMTPRARAILQSEGFYYHITDKITGNTCASVMTSDKENRTITVENTVFKTSFPLPIRARMDVPVVKVRCIYASNFTKARSLKSESPIRKTESRVGKYDLPQNDAAVGKALSQSILLNGHTFNYQKWIDVNPYQDPDKYTELIKRNGGIDNIIKKVNLGKIPVVPRAPPENEIRGKNRLLQIRARAANGNPCPGAPPGCHCGPYERLDPCNPIYHTTPQPTTQAPTTTPKPTTRVLITTYQATTGEPTTVYNSVLEMKLYKDEELSEEIGLSGIGVGTKMFVSIAPQSNLTSGVCLYVRACWIEINATNSVNSKNVIILEEGCPVSDNALGVRMLENGKSHKALFSFRSVRFRDVNTSSANHVKCKVTICDCSVEACAKDCSRPNSRTKRSIPNDEVRNVQASFFFESHKANK